MDQLKNILFLDTSIFENQNFLKGHYINKLGELGKIGEVEIKITEITYREVLSRIRKNLISTETQFKKAYDLLDNNGKILKNLDEYNNFYSLPQFNIEVYYEILKKKVDQFISNSKIQIVSLENASIKEVFEQYFNNEKPFGEGQKKCEFPDAFTLNVIEKWVIQNNSEVTVLSIDKDLLDYAPQLHNIHIVSSLTEYLASITDRLEQNKQKLEFFTLESLHSEAEIEYELNDSLYDSITYDLIDHIRADPWVEELEYEFNKFEETKVVSSIVSDLNEEFVFIENIVDTDLRIYFEFNDLSSGFYDREDGRWYNVEYSNEERVYEIRLKLMVKFSYEYSTQTRLIDLNEVEFLEIIKYKEKRKIKINNVKE